MADDRFSRFKNLEKGRREEAKAAPISAPGRFGSLERRPDAAPAAASAVTTERFAPSSAPASQPGVDLELAEVRAGDQPFVRCARCHVDSHALATVCSHCGTSLETAEQRAYNERLWAEHQAQAAKEAPPGAADVPAPVRQAGRPSGLDPGQQRAVAEAMAREAASQARARIDGAGLGFGYDPGTFTTNWVLSRLPGGLLQVLALIALVVPAVLILIPSTRFFGALSLFVVVAVLVRIWLAR